MLAEEIDIDKIGKIHSMLHAYRQVLCEQSGLEQQIGGGCGSDMMLIVRKGL